MNKKSIGINILGGVTFGYSIIANLTQLLWTVWLTKEQIQTGWGFPTNMEMFALVVWLTQLLCLPALILGAVYLILHIRKKSAKWLFVSNAFMLATLAVQYILINLFINF